MTSRLFSYKLVWEKHKGWYVEHMILLAKTMTLFDELGKSVDLYSSIYDKFFLIGAFNADEFESCLIQFLNDHYKVSK